ncbi:MAG: VUT family protein [Prevotella sp.]|nr:VUT family protein [Staphylococcus sp.]MCM1349849.1 VUT family protein [Prevotella sp.]
MIKKLKQEFYELKILLRSIPSLVLALFVLSVIAMNLLANKSIDLSIDWLALDCGIIFSWLSFLTMDMMTKHFGPKASTQISILAAMINLLFCTLFFLASRVPGVWGESYIEGSETIINSALNNTFGGIWYVLLGSSIAFLGSAFVNNISNWTLGKLFKKDNFRSFAWRSYLSTALGQLVDNLIFALLVSHFFFDWSLVQCFTCALTGMIVELVCEIVFSPLGYVICKDWKQNHVGNAYFEYMKGKEN